MMNFKRIVFILTLIIFIKSTSTAFATTPIDSLKLSKLKNTKEVKKEANGKVVTGIASYYSANLEGSKVAIPGERFSHSKPNVASNFFKLGTWVRVTNVKNGKSIIARVNDRMHPRMAKIGRVVDVTNQHAKYLGFLKSGLVQVIVEEVPKGTKK